MQSQDISLESRDGTALRAVDWRPDGGDIAGCVVLVHGLAEHMGRYGHVAAALTGAGMRVLGVELRGHGGSAGPRGHVDAWEQYTDDVLAALNHVGEPCWLLAHSMGGLVVLDLLLTLGQNGAARGGGGRVSGVVLSNPLLGVAVKAPAWKTGLAGVLSKLVPRLSLSNEVNPRHISRDPEVVQAYVNDPRVFKTVTPRWYVEMTGAIERVNAAAGSYRAPLLALLSDQDRLCNPAASRQFMGRYGGPHEERRYPELYHELFNEPEKVQVLADLVAWLAKAGS